MAEETVGDNGKTHGICIRQWTRHTDGRLDRWRENGHDVENETTDFLFGHFAWMGTLATNKDRESDVVDGLV